MGPSAVGKETFIMNALETNLADIDQSYVQKRVTYSRKSIDCIAQFRDDPIGDKREDLIFEVKKLLEDNDVVMVKWQLLDSNTDRLNRLRVSLPDVSHKILLLDTSDKELQERLVHKSWWRESYDVTEWIKDEREQVKQEIDLYCNNFEIIRYRQGS
jgi:hypothetical protein